ETITVYGYCDPDTYPLPKGRISFTKLRQLAHLRPRTNSFGALTRIRNQLAKATHNFFQEQNFIYLHTPIITGSDCEGAGEMFRVTALDLKQHAGSNIDFKKDFFGRETFLTVSGQLEAEIYACALGNVYTFGPTFRAENSNTSRHLAEFWMIEPEMAFCNLEEDADTAEAYLKYIINTLLAQNSEDLELFNRYVDSRLLERLKKITNDSFQRLTYTRAVSLLQEKADTFKYPAAWGNDLQTEHERYLTEKYFQKPVIVTDYPRHIKAFYMKQNEDRKTVRAMDILFPQIGEIIGGSQREDDYDKLYHALQEKNLDPAGYDWYLDLRRFGTIPHSGFGLGFERLVQFCTGMQNIRDVIPFPRTPQNAAF
ncbi:MAG TPA: asparagine--tRNA ligase, partial [Spirochaetota bacterium]|nr:asparagine--tRNA ligase [Spirochaetota bacterium]